MSKINLKQEVCERSCHQFLVKFKSTSNMNCEASAEAIGDLLGVVIKGGVMFSSLGSYMQ